MGDLGPFPEFSLSASSLSERDCDRKLYWSHYGYWYGWKPSAPWPTRTAYLLKKARSRFSLLGDAVHYVAAALVRATMTGLDLEAALGASRAKATAKYRKTLDDAVDGRWRGQPKDKPAVLELLYATDDPENTPAAVRDWVDARLGPMTDTLMESQHIAALQEGATVLESETLHGFHVELDVDLRGANVHEATAEPVNTVKVWTQPDLVYAHAGSSSTSTAGPAVVVDWKTGRERDEHEEQLNVYGLYVAQELRRPVERISLAATYLEDGEETVIPFNQAKAGAVRRRIIAAVDDRRRRVVGGDLVRNEPLPMEEAFPMLPADARACRWCDFRRLCQRG